jgi:hypothetical protein
MARPKTRTLRHELRLTPAEKESWSKKAAAVGIDLSEYIRRCVERRTIPSVIPEVNRQTAAELGRIGVNLNQQIRAMNTAVASGQNINNVGEALSYVKGVEETLKKLQLELMCANDRQND